MSFYTLLRSDRFVFDAYKLNCHQSLTTNVQFGHCIIQLQTLHFTV